MRIRRACMDMINNNKMYKAVKCLVKKTQLKHKLADLHKLAEAHLNNGVPKGHLLFVTLQTDARKVCAEYMQSCSVPESQLRAEIPFINQLDMYATPERKVGKVFAYLGVYVIVALGVGAFLGIVQFAARLF